jgi:hypothetical protein
MELQYNQHDVYISKNSVNADTDNFNNLGYSDQTCELNSSGETNSYLDPINNDNYNNYNNYNNYADYQLDTNITPNNIIPPRCIISNLDIFDDQTFIENESNKLKESALLHLDIPDNMIKFEMILIAQHFKIIKKIIKNLRKLFSTCCINFKPNEIDSYSLSNSSDNSGSIDSHNTQKCKQSEVFSMCTDSNVTQTKESKCTDCLSQRGARVQIIGIKHDKQILVHTTLYAYNFVKFYCKKTNMKININLNDLYEDMLKIKNNDLFYFMINEKKSDMLHIFGYSLFNNADQLHDLSADIAHVQHFLKTTNVENIQFIPAVLFDLMIKLSLDEFIEICDLQNKNDGTTFIQIKCFQSDSAINESNSIIHFNLHNKEGNIYKTKIFYQKSNSSMDNQLQTNSNIEIFNHSYELKLLEILKDYNNLSSSIKLYMKKNYPLVIKLSANTLGNIYLFLSGYNNI